MRRTFIILGFFASVLAIVLSVTPLSKIAFIPAVAALLFGLVAFYFSRQKQYPKKSIQLIFLLTIISLSIASYKAVFDVVEVGNIKGLEQRGQESEEKAIEELEGLELNDIDLNDAENFQHSDSIL